MFLLVGIAQLALDSGVFIASTALGASVVAGNLLGRTSGALLGFWLNGRWTFGKRQLDWKHALRFALAWLALTALSTALISLVATRLGLHDAWLAKPLVEAGLAAVSFFLWKYVVYR
ncbi:MAG TPA: GtrA family protein [Xanthomonadaceae bacterium]|nr:GtrA family protein [Xanthomonadaceae bacterium]